MEQKNKFYLTISGVDYEIKPHYKQLKKRYKKENNQNYFRESLDGKITLFNNTTRPARIYNGIMVAKASRRVFR